MYRISLNVWVEIFISDLSLAWSWWFCVWRSRRVLWWKIIVKNLVWVQNNLKHVRIIFGSIKRKVRSQNNSYHRKFKISNRSVKFQIWNNLFINYFYFFINACMRNKFVLVLCFPLSSMINILFSIHESIDSLSHQHFFSLFLAWLFMLIHCQRVNNKIVANQFQICIDFSFDLQIFKNAIFNLQVTHWSSFRKLNLSSIYKD